MMSPEMREAVARLRRDLELQDGGGIAYTCQDALYTVVVQGEDLRLVLATLGAGEGWRPMADAPRDGTPFLTFTPDDTFSSITGIEVMWFDSQLGLVFGPDCSEPVFMPTHWRPLPAAPARPEQGRGGGTPSTEHGRRGKP